MLSQKMRHAGGALAAVALAVSLAACAPEPAPGPVSAPPTMAPDQSVAEACGLSSDEVDALVADAKAQLDAAGKALTAGEIPDVGAFGETLQQTLDGVSDGVTNPEVLAALDEVRTEVEGFARIEAPGSLLEVPGYLGSLGTQLGQLQAAGQQLQELCSAG